MHLSESPTMPPEPVENRARGAIPWVTYVVLGIGAICTLGSLIWHARWNTGLMDWLVVAGFAMWAGGPYVALGVINGFARSAAASVIVLIGSVLAVGGGLAAYYHAFYVNLDPQSALAYLSVPFVQWAGAGLLFLVWGFVEIRSRRRETAGGQGVFERRIR